MSLRLSVPSSLEPFDILDSIDQGFCVCEMIVDDAGRPRDYRFLKVNRSFEQQTGLVSPTGRTALELVPDLEAHWVDLYGRVALTREPARFVQGSEAMGRWFDVFAFAVDEPATRRFGILFRDVTDRKRADDRLRESEERLRAAGQAADVGTWRVDLHTHLDTRDASLNRLLGLDAVESTQPIGDFIRAVHPDDRASVEAKIASAIETAGTYHAECRIVRPDGSIRWLLDQGRVLHDEQGEPRYLTGAAVDITRHKQIEDALHESEMRFRNMADFAPVMVWVAEPDASCSFLSKSWYEFTGQTPASGLGFGWLDALHPVDRAEFESTFLRSSTRREAFRLDYRLRGRDGAFCWMAGSAAPRVDATGTYLGYIGSVLDITERKRREFNARFLLALSADVASLSDAEGLMRVVAARIGEYLKASRSVFVEYDLPKDEARVVCDWVRGGGDSAVGVYRLSEFFAPDAIRLLTAGAQVVVADTTVGDSIAGGAVAARWGIRALVNTPHLTDGRWRASLTVQQDVPRQWTVDELELLSEVTARVWARVDRARAERRLRESEAELRSASHLKDEFLATLSHELRTPLSAVIGWAHMLRSTTLTPEMTSRALEALERNAKAQAQLVDDLLDVSRIVSGRLDLGRELVELSSVVADAVDTVRVTAEAKNVTLQVHADGLADLQMIGDADRIRQIVWNLLTNAIKFTPAGGRVDVSLRRLDVEVHIVVQDTGQGIEADFLPFVFDRFRQQGTGPHRQRGLGLGLAIVRHLTEAHGGTVDVHSDGPGRGARFTARFPATRAAGSGSLPL